MSLAGQFSYTPNLTRPQTNYWTQILPDYTDYDVEAKNIPHFLQDQFVKVTKKKLRQKNFHIEGLGIQRKEPGSDLFAVKISFQKDYVGERQTFSCPEKKSMKNYLKGLTQQAGKEVATEDKDKMVSILQQYLTTSNQSLNTSQARVATLEKELNQVARRLQQSNDQLVKYKNFYVNFLTSSAKLNQTIQQQNVQIAQLNQFTQRQKEEIRQLKQLNPEKEQIKNVNNQFVMLPHPSNPFNQLFTLTKEYSNYVVRKISGGGHWNTFILDQRFGHNQVHQIKILNANANEFVVGIGRLNQNQRTISNIIVAKDNDKCYQDPNVVMLHSGTGQVWRYGRILYGSPQVKVQSGQILNLMVDTQSKMIQWRIDQLASTRCSFSNIYSEGGMFLFIMLKQEGDTAALLL